MALSTDARIRLEKAMASRGAADEVGNAIDNAADSANHVFAGNVQVGGAGSTVGFFGSAGVVISTAYTQTYATATRTHANPTGVSVATTAATNSSPYGYAQAQADAIVTNLNAVIVDVANVKQVLNSVIDDLQAYNLLH